MRLLLIISGNDRLPSPSPIFHARIIFEASWLVISTWRHHSRARECFPCWGNLKRRPFELVHLRPGMQAGDVSFHVRAESAGCCAGVLCGAAASGAYEWTPESVGKSALCMLMSGPLLTGYTQTINDYYDREIDAINEPNRPIPSGTQEKSPVSPTLPTHMCSL